ncbi:MAG: GNAT family N-acetyltransferase [Micromonosporaceae bacterium]|nr:GNAT family N-acetyltransferase [Micromonosporaceae bacterium]
MAGFGELDTATLYGLLRLRVDVFVVEQRCPYPDLDGRDTEPATRHLWLERAGVPVAYLRLLAEPGTADERVAASGRSASGARDQAARADGTAVRISRVVVAPADRGGGLAGRLLAAALVEVGDRECVLAAQSRLAGFYGRLGFVPTGPEYVDDGIWHLPMRRAPDRIHSAGGPR